MLICTLWLKFPQTQAKRMTFKEFLLLLDVNKGQFEPFCDQGKPEYLIRNKYRAETLMWKALVMIFCNPMLSYKCHPVKSV